MRILLVTPVPPDSNHGNARTAVRWSAVLRGQGHDVVLRHSAEEIVEADVLVALHARKSGAALAAFQQRWPGHPVVLVLTGTDLYADLPDDPTARRSVASADRIVVLQERGAERLPATVRARVRVIPQPAVAHIAWQPANDTFGICVLAHLRAVKDPLLAARAAALLPATSRIRVSLAGAVIDTALGVAATEEAGRNPRFRWLGELDAAGAEQLLAHSRALVVSSSMEGGANAVAEAIVHGVPVLATAVDGNLGLLGADYPGVFPVGDAAALAGLMVRAETDRAWFGALQEAVVARQPFHRPELEAERIRQLLAELEISLG